MAHPPFFTRHTSYRQAESAGLPLSTSHLDGEMNDVATVVSQIVQRLMGITTADGILKNLAQATAQALAGMQRFAAAAAQTVYTTTIAWDTAFSASSVLVSVDGAVADSALVSVADNGGYLEVTYTPGVPLVGGEVVQVAAFSPGAGIATLLASFAPGEGASQVGVADVDALYAGNNVESCLREMRLVFDTFIAAINSNTGDAAFTATAGQTIFECNVAPSDIPWDDSMLGGRNVFVYVNDVLLSVDQYAAADNAGFLRVTLDVGAPVGADVRVLSYSLANVWGSNGTDLAGRPAQADFDMGGHRHVNVADGVGLQDTATVNQLLAVTAAFAGAAASFIRVNGSNSPTSDISWNGKRLTALGAPVDPGDATNKAYVDAGLAPKAPLASPALTGTPTAPTPAPGDNTTKIATTEFVTNAIATADLSVHPVVAAAGDAMYHVQKSATGSGAFNIAFFDAIGGYYVVNIVPQTTPVVPSAFTNVEGFSFYAFTTDENAFASTRVDSLELVAFNRTTGAGTIRLAGYCEASGLAQCLLGPTFDPAVGLATNRSVLHDFTLGDPLFKIQRVGGDSYNFNNYIEVRFEAVLVGTDWEIRMYTSMTGNTRGGGPDYFAFDTVSAHSLRTYQQLVYT